MNLPTQQYELATQDGVDLRNHRRRPMWDYDIIEQEQKQKQKQKRSKNNANSKRSRRQ